MSPALRGAALFGLAQAQWQTGQHGPAIANGRKALVEHEASKASDAEALAEQIREWLAERSAGQQRRGEGDHGSGGGHQ